jgi:hypothetical protein
MVFDCTDYYQISNNSKYVYITSEQTQINFFLAFNVSNMYVGSLNVNNISGIKSIRSMTFEFELQWFVWTKVGWSVHATQQ